MTEAIQDNPSTDVSSEAIADKLNAVFERLNSGLIERDTEIRLAVLGALSGEHLLLIGPPGTAKSEIARRLVRAIGGDEIFERLLTRFSVPEELFGPLSLKALEDDRYERNITKYLPTARVAFIDEIFKANSAILNSLLTILNERQFDNGTERVDVPLVTLVGASNELPEGEELQALYDRFLLRRHVLPVSEGGFVEMLALDEDGDGDSRDVILSSELIEHVQLVAPAVAVPREVIEFIAAMRKYLAKEEIYVSDRRWRKALKLLQVAAYTNGQEEVSIWECKLLEHCLWNTPEEQETIREWYEARVGVDAKETSHSGRFEQVTTGLESLLKKESRSQRQVQERDGELLYYDAEGQPSTDPDPDELYHEMNVDGELLYYAPRGTDEREAKKKYTKDEIEAEFADGSKEIREPGRWIALRKYIDVKTNKVFTHPAPVLETQRYSEGHINSRLNQAAAALTSVSRHLAHLDKELEALEQRIHGHLWLESSFGESAVARLKIERERAANLKERLEVVHEGFGELPRESNETEV